MSAVVGHTVRQFSTLEYRANLEYGKKSIQILMEYLNISPRCHRSIIIVAPEYHMRGMAGFFPELELEL